MHSQNIPNITISAILFEQSRPGRLAHWKHVTPDRLALYVDGEPLPPHVAEDGSFDGWIVPACLFGRTQPC